MHAQTWHLQVVIAFCPLMPKQGRCANLWELNKALWIEKLGLPRSVPPVAHAGLTSWLSMTRLGELAG